MKKLLCITLALFFCFTFVACSTGTSKSTESDGKSQDTTVNVPKYSVVTNEDISIAGKTRETYRIATEKNIDDSMAKAIAIDATAESMDIDEVTVWIYDNASAAEQGEILNKMYDVTLSKGKVVEVIKNDLYGK